MRSEKDPTDPVRPTLHFTRHYGVHLEGSAAIFPNQAADSHLAGAQRDPGRSRPFALSRDEHLIATLDALALQFCSIAISKTGQQSAPRSIWYQDLLPLFSARRSSEAWIVSSQNRVSRSRWRPLMHWPCFASRGRFFPSRAHQRCSRTPTTSPQRLQPVLSLLGALALCIRQISLDQACDVAPGLPSSGWFDPRARKSKGPVTSPSCRVEGRSLHHRRAHFFVFEQSKCAFLFRGCRQRRRHRALWPAGHPCCNRDQTLYSTSVHQLGSAEGVTRPARLALLNPPSTHLIRGNSV
jgi:hypothetical protein